MGIAGKLKIKSFCLNPFRENCYILSDDDGSCVIVDPGCYTPSELRSLKEYISQNELTPTAIWLTHGHFDHLFGAAGLSRDYSVPVWMSPEDKTLVERDGEFAIGVGLNPPDVSFSTRDLSDGQILRLAQDDKDKQILRLAQDDNDDILNGSEESLTFQVIATPGHTQGCVCFYSEDLKILLTGDTLFAGAIGRTDLFGGDYDKEIVSIMDKLMGLPGDVEVLPGHGPATTIAEERTGNPFLRPWGGVDDEII